MFMPLRRPHQILNVALVKETVFSANGWKQFGSKNNPGMICLWVSFFFFLFSVILPPPPSFTLLHEYSWIYSDCSCVWKERDWPRATMQVLSQATDRKTNPINLSDTLACASTKTTLRRRHCRRDHALPALSSFPGCFQVSAAAWADCAGEGRREIRKQQ